MLKNPNDNDHKYDLPERGEYGRDRAEGLLWFHADVATFPTKPEAPVTLETS